MDYTAMQLGVSRELGIREGVLALKGKLLFRGCVMGNQRFTHLKYPMSHVANH